MPRFSTEQVTTKNFGFSRVSLDDLGGTEYTLVGISIDTSGSISGHERDLEKMANAIIDGISVDSQGNPRPRANNMLVRISTFDRGVHELIGFQPPLSIDRSLLKFTAGGTTSLVDAFISDSEAIQTTAQDMTDRQLEVNSIQFIITDGEENTSTLGRKENGPDGVFFPELKKAIDGTSRKEILESHLSVIVHINSGDTISKRCVEELLRSGIDQVEVAKDASPQSLAKIAGFASESISSQSQALGTGGPSQLLTL